jgi:hypothetical protein
MQSRQLRFALVASFLAGMFSVALCVRAADEKKGNLDGTWKWSITGQDGQTFDASVKLKQDGEKVTGTYVGRDNQESAIADGKIKDGELSFVVTREFNGNKIVFHYHGKVEGDAIKGKIDSERDGQTRSRDWEAKRDAKAGDKKDSDQKDGDKKDAASVAGTWKYTFTRPDGTTMDWTLKLKQDGEKVTGNAVNDANNSEVEIKQGKISGNDVTFEVERERDGNKFIVHYNGKLEGDAMKGKVTVNFNGEDRSFDWEAKRAK